MKTEYFKFQDGKVFWLPEYPEKDPYIKSFMAHTIDGPSWVSYAVAEEAYTSAVAQSLASAIEVAPEDREKVKSEIWWANIWTLEEDKKHGNKVTLDPIINAWQPEKDKIYSAECEMKTKEKCRHGCRLDPFVPRPAAINVQDVCLNGDKLTCVFYSQVARLKSK